MVQEVSDHLECDLVDQNLVRTRMPTWSKLTTLRVVAVAQDVVECRGTDDRTSG
jgi:hypothetical protein